MSVIDWVFVMTEAAVRLAKLISEQSLVGSVATSKLVLVELFEFFSQVMLSRFRKQFTVCLFARNQLSNFIEMI